MEYKAVFFKVQLILVCTIYNFILIIVPIENWARLEINFILKTKRMFSYDLVLNLQQMLGFLLGGFILLFEKLNIECHPDTTDILIFYSKCKTFK